ncbi:MAG: amidohydrolase family protein, partial [Actinomycetota bacterium]
FLQGREPTTPQPRGLTAIATLRKTGVRVAIGADNLQDPFNPIGRGDPLESAGLAILTAHLLPQDAFDAVSSVARQVMGLDTTTISVGQTANLMLTRAAGLREAIATTAERPLVMRNGVVVSSRLAAVN